MSKLIRVVPYDPDWPAMFHRAAAEIRPVFGNNLLELHHIGSTSIPGIHAKPILDMLAEVKYILAVDAINPKITSLGFEALGEFGIPGRRYFRKDDSQGIRIQQIHTFQTGSDDISRHLAFRDFMRTHPIHAAAYSALKQQLAREYPFDMASYMDGKDGFIKEMQQKALQWVKSSENV